MRREAFSGHRPSIHPAWSLVRQQWLLEVQTHQIPLTSGQSAPVASALSRLLHGQVEKSGARLAEPDLLAECLDLVLEYQYPALAILSSLLHCCTFHCSMLAEFWLLLMLRDRNACTCHFTCWGRCVDCWRGRHWCPSTSRTSSPRHPRRRHHLLHEHLNLVRRNAQNFRRQLC